MLLPALSTLLVLPVLAALPELLEPPFEWTAGPDAAGPAGPSGHEAAGPEAAEADSMVLCRRLEGDGVGEGV